MACSSRDAIEVAKLLAKVREAWHSTYDSTKGPVLSLEPRQCRSRIDRGPSPSIWTSQVTFPKPPENDVRDAVASVVESLGDGNGSLTLSRLHASPVTAEWVAIKRDANATAAGPSSRDRYNALTADVMSPATIIFIHGGAFFLNGLGTSRPTAARLSKESGTRVLVLDYRLAPQTAFPAQILDLFILYLSLIYPPLDSFHEPIPASSIVIAGESSGANIALAFTQLLLHLQQQQLHLSKNSSGGVIRFHGHQLIASQLPSPAGISTLSAQGEQAHALPSFTRNLHLDIWKERPPFLEADFPADAIWPTDPPRADVYCETPAELWHPLVSPCLAKSWKGAPAMFFAVGEESLADGAMLIAQECAWEETSGGVRFVQYQAMPHCWPFMLPRLKQSEDVWRRWGRACREMVEEGGSLSGRRGGVWVGLDGVEKDVNVREMTALTVEEAEAMVKEGAKLREIYWGNKRKNAGLRL